MAAAADLKFALDELVTEFQAKHPSTTVKVTYGSSGNFYAQLQNQAPFDLYFSADIAYPRKLAEAGLALDGDLFLYAVGRIVVWTPSQSPVKVEQLGIQSLFAPSVKKIAIANPQHAPYGVAAVAALKSLKVYEQAEPKLVYGENIAQTAQFVQSGAADIGIIALSLAIAPPMRERGPLLGNPARRLSEDGTGRHHPELDKRRGGGPRLPRFRAGRAWPRGAQTLRILSARKVRHGLASRRIEPASVGLHDPRARGLSGCRWRIGSQIRACAGSFSSRLLSRCPSCCRPRCWVSTC